NNDIVKKFFIEGVSRLSSLKILQIDSQCNYIYDDAFFKALTTGCQKIEELHFLQFRVGLQIFKKWIQQFKNLKVLTIKNPSKFTPHTLKHVLENCPKMRSLTLIGCNLMPSYGASFAKIFAEKGKEYFKKLELINCSIPPGERESLNKLGINIISNPQI